MDMVNYLAWQGRIKTDEGEISAQDALKIHLSLGEPAETALKAGDTLPPLYHWCAFPPRTTTSDLGADGHARLGSFLPPLPLTRRMWAGGHLTFHAPLKVGDPLRSRSEVLQIDEKGTPETPMVFVTVGHDITGPRGLAVSERQTLVYLNIPDTYSPPPKRPMPDAAIAARQLDVDAATLFRFSAVTFNTHRIHYDLAHTQQVEHYPDLIIHGPLQAMQLIRLAQAHRGRPPKLFEYRGVHPMILGAPLDLAATEDEDGGLKLYAGQSGHQGTQAHAVWEETQ